MDKKMISLHKASIAFAVLSAIFFALSIVPLFALTAFAFAAFVLVLFALVVFIVGGFIGVLLLASGRGFLDTALAFGNKMLKLAGSIFDVLLPVGSFCISYISPYTCGLGILCGVIGIVIAAVTLSMINKNPEYAALPMGSAPATPTAAAPAAETEPTLDGTPAPTAEAMTDETPELAPEKPDTLADTTPAMDETATPETTAETLATPDTATPDTATTDTPATPAKPKKPKKVRTHKGSVSACLAVSIVFGILSAILEIITVSILPEIIGSMMH